MPNTNPFDLGKNRSEALSDGVFAIAMTILVLSFKLPTLPPTAPNVEVASAIYALWPALLTYSVAFIGLGVYWILHHMVFHVVRVVDGTLLWLNILFFLFISVLPFSVQLVDQFPRAEIVPVLFGINLAIVGWLLYLQWIYALAHPKLMVEDLSRPYWEEVSFRILLAPVTATLTSLICFWSVSTSLVIYGVLLLYYFLPVGRRDRGAESVKRWRFARRTLGAISMLAVGVGWYLFRPELLLLNTRVNENLSLTHAQKLLTGSFKGIAHQTAGQAMIYELDGRRVLRFTQFSTSDGPDVHVYLVAAPDASSDDVVRHAGFINLGKMKGNQGDQNYDLPSNADLSMYRSVSLWCERFNVNFGACTLR